MDYDQIYPLFLGAIVAYIGYIFRKRVDKVYPSSAASRLVREWVVMLLIILGAIIIRTDGMPKDAPRYAESMQYFDSFAIAFLSVHIYGCILRIKRFKKELRNEMNEPS